MAARTKNKYDNVIFRFFSLQNSSPLLRLRGRPPAIFIVRCAGKVMDDSIHSRQDTGHPAPRTDPNGRSLAHTAPPSDIGGKLPAAYRPASRSSLPPRAV